MFTFMVVLHVNPKMMYTIIKVLQLLNISIIYSFVAQIKFRGI